MKYGLFFISVMFLLNAVLRVTLKDWDGVIYSVIIFWLALELAARWDVEGGRP